ncbi:phosphodiesterase [Dysosmobacter sp.]
MKWMIASDLHGSALYGELLLTAYRREGADRLVLLGDLLYHGPRNDLPAGYDPKRLAGMLNAMRREIFCVRGNCDAEVDQMVLEFPILAEYALLDLGGLVVFAAHGHHFHEKNPPPMGKGDVLLCGHTHVPACIDHGDYVYMNPGSVSIPKEGSVRGYMTLEGGVFRWRDLAGGLLREYEVRR